ncbi:hypothetical protein FNH09_40070 [Streptomyces adustus]|uniref:Uncharacterized protein n=1 Tax=Streptomyces adustus TaxID=1609272 RepID=A0A5N8VR92_9ACTN|nr:hypothetical protein [Streptomyces adustus]MPY37186.1 hypothetical protein [Streptomyces adustus]
MTTSSWDRSERIAAAVSIFTVIAVVAGAVILALGVCLPKAWWPHTGQAFAAVPAPANGRQDPCARIVGPAKKYCERGATTTASDRQDVGGGAWGLLPAGAGVGALVVWRRSSSAGRRRR